MSKFRLLFVAAAAAVLATGCARFTQGASSGDVLDPQDASQTVVLHVDNHNPGSMELRLVAHGQSKFIGSVSGNDTTSILLDPTAFPSATIYVLAIPADGHGRAIAGPLAASKGDKINFSVEPALDMSHATVNR